MLSVGPWKVDLKKDHIQAAPESHIFIHNQGQCQECRQKDSTLYCASQVYPWQGDHLNVEYQRCIECGACYVGCPQNNIEWNYPQPGFGVTYNF